MKRLHLLRHGKASRKFFEIDDFDRPLTEKGILESHRNAEDLFAKGLKPANIISSSAARALSTAVIFRKELQLDETAFRVTDQLYEISYRNLVDLICNLENHLADVMLVGHNPSFSMLSEEISAEYSHIPTGAVIGFKVDIGSWKEFDPVLAKPEYYIKS
mgnify:CR=1 FL=1